MSDHILVLNAGSSSVKFAVYGRAANGWADEARGQIEGIGTAPKFSAKDAAGEKLVDEKLGADVRDARSALGGLAAWLRKRFPDAKLVGVGHRVVHGGSRHAAPALVTDEVLADLRALIPLAQQSQTVLALAAGASASRAEAAKAAARPAIP